jgi:hypothetical protein
VPAADPVSELGYPKPDPAPAGELPPGGAKWLVPHHWQHSAVLDWLGRTYHWTHDDALRDSETNAEAMWADTVINSAVMARVQPVVGLEHQLEPRDPSDKAQKDLADDLAEVLEDVPDFQGLKVNLARGCWPGRAAVQVVLKWDFASGRQRLLVDSWDPIHGDSLVFKFDGSPGILVNSQLVGRPNVERVSGRGGAAYFPPPEKRQCLVVYEFERQPAAFFRPELAGSVHGSGLRGQVYWYWWLRHNLSRFLFDFVRKAGQGFFLAGYPAGQRQSLVEMKKALEEQAGNPIIYVPLDGQMDMDRVLKHLGVNLSGSELQLRIISYLNDLIRDRILGETNANRPAPTGIGGTQAEQRGMTDDERVKYDAKSLEAPLQYLINTLARNMRPNVRPPKFRFLCDKRNPEELIGSANWFMQAGGTIPKSWAQQQLGIPDPQPGDDVLGIVQAQQATALGAVPAGVPMQGTPGPAAPPGQPGQAGLGAPPQAADPQEAALAAQIQPDGGRAQMARPAEPVRLAYATPPPEPAPGPVVIIGEKSDGRIDAVGRAVADLNDRVAELVRHQAAAAGRPDPIPAPPADLGPVLAAVEALKAEVHRPRTRETRVTERDENGQIKAYTTEEA